jgi:hypothetical protein
MSGTGPIPPHGFASRLAALFVDSRLTPLAVAASLLLASLP